MTKTGLDGIFILTGAGSLTRGRLTWPGQTEIRNLADPSRRGGEGRSILNLYVFDN